MDESSQPNGSSARFSKPSKKIVVALRLPEAAAAAPAHDLVTDSLPGFPPAPYPFKLYSGYLHVPGPFKETR